MAMNPLIWIVCLLFVNTGMAASLVQTQEIRIGSTARHPDVIYGNPEVGFFSAKKLERQKKNQWKVSFIPPSYQVPILFYENSGGQKKLLLKKIFKAPLGHPSALNIQMRGALSIPYLLMNLTTRETNPSSYYPAAINRLGEVVWYDKSHLTPQRNLESSSNLSLLPWEGGVFVRGAGENSFWNLVAWDGIATKLRPVELAGKRLDAHHSMGLGAKEIFFWTALTQKISPMKDSIPVFRGIAGWWRGLGEEGRIIVGNRLVGLNPETGALRSVFTTFDLTTPAKSPSRSLDENMDRFLDAHTVAEYRALKSVNDPEFYISERYDTDWSHENSVDITPDGNFLITIRNLNSVVLLSPEGKLLWAIGNEKFSTHKWKPSQASLGLPHSARWISKDRIVVFDNAASFRGMVKGASQSRALWLHLLPNGNIEIEKEVIMPGDKSLTKGSIRPIGTEGFLIWHPGPHTGVAQCLETDRAGNVTGHLTMDWPGYKKHDEVLPLSNLGDPFVEGAATKSKTIYLDGKYDEEVY